MNKRESGYYWAIVCDESIIVQLIDGEWLIHGSEDVYEEGHFNWIGPRIEPPEEQEATHG